MIDYKNYMIEEPKKSIRHSLLVAGALGLIIAAMAVSCVKGIDKTIELEELNNAPLREQRQKILDRNDKLVSAFQTAGSPDPHLMAKACRATSKPKIMAAIAIVESNGTPTATGKAGERGAWQVIGKHHGKVSSNPVDQAKQAERILDELVAASPRGSLRCALARYNGGDKPKAVSYRYADKVLKVRRALG